ncbi:hypothetical protein L484_026015 [Morus notabilis]|uniref:Protein BZR1 homolog n=1 Tax=Morus notabilis TaxID=981085 RepID=W9RWC9_9ROSA|nr:protein BZR1 homolog 4 [Morus notabilis]EXB75233.1 hypothetical protein L484_026015 [Morus notabilis]
MAANGTTSSLGGRSESEKEKTKMRERQRRAITGKIFHGLRKHGGYRLSPRADINEVLRYLAAEAGWTVLPDGTTFRSNVGNCCPTCGETRSSATPTPSSTVVVAGGGGGECSTTASPRRFTVGDPAIAVPASSLCNVAGGTSSVDGDIPMAALYNMYGGGFPGGLQQYSSVVFNGGGPSPVAFQQQHLQEARASNQNTPVGSPLRRA